MKTIYLHIGTFKTGTTAIQRFLKENSKWFSEQGFFIPDSQLIAHHPLPLSLIMDYSSFRAAWPNFSGNSSEIWSQTFKQIALSTCENVIISSETFCDLANEHARDGKNDFIRILKHYFSGYNVKIICYLRELGTYTASMYKEAIKAGGITNSYPEEMLQYIKQHSIHLFPTEYLNFYSELFGKKNIIIRYYDRKKLINENIIDDFLDIFKLTPNFSTTLQSNLSLNDNTVDLMRTLNFVKLNDEIFSKQLSNALIEASKPQNTASELVNLLQKNIEEETQRLKHDFNIDLSSDLITSDFHNHLNEETHFLILLMGNIIKENKILKQKLDTIELKLDQLLSNS